MKDFFQALQDAQTLPDVPDTNNPIPDMLRGSDFAKTVRTVAPGTPGKIANATEYDFQYACARLQIGQKLVGYVDGQAQYEDIDESDRLKEIMDMSLSGEAVITKKLETFLKEGSIIIWIEWMEPKVKIPKKDRGYLTEPELLSPALMTCDDEDTESSATEEESDN